MIKNKINQHLRLNNPIMETSLKQLFAERFKSARLLSGYSLQDLADKLENKITRQGLHKYEKGEVIPDSDMINLLSNALRVNPDYFFRETNVQLGELEFRKLKKLPAKEQSKIIETTKDTLSRYLELEEIIGIETSFVNPLHDWPVIDSFEKVEEASLKVRAAWNLGTGPIANSFELLEDNHIKVIEVHSEDSFDGLQTWVNSNIPVIAINMSGLKSPDRLRFTALHELGHLLLPLTGLTEKARENYCHQFAAAMLFPREIAFKELGKSRNKLYVQELGVLKQQYGISIQAIIYRAKELGIISDAYKKQFLFFMDQNHWRVVEPIAFEGIEKSNRFKQLIFRALAEELISVNKAAVLSDQSLQDFRKQFMSVG